MDSFRDGGILGKGNSRGNGSHAEIHLACLMSDEISVTGVECVRERIHRRGGQRGNQGVGKYRRSLRFLNEMEQDVWGQMRNVN